MDRKGILRHVLPRIVVDVQGQSERVHVRLEWVGGASTTAELIRPVQRWEQLSYYPQLCARAVALAHESRSAADIATQLNVEGWRLAKQVEQFGPQGVLGVPRQLGVTRPHFANLPRTGLAAAEWWLPDLARALDLPTVPLYGGWRRGWVTGRDLGQRARRCALWADEKRSHALASPPSTTRGREASAALAHRPRPLVQHQTPTIDKRITHDDQEKPSLSWG